MMDFEMQNRIEELQEKYKEHQLMLESQRSMVKISELLLDTNSLLMHILKTLENYDLPIRRVNVGNIAGWE